MKTFTLVLAFFLSTIFLQAQAQSQLLSGSFSFNSSVAGYTLDKNTGDRSTSIEVTFDKPFDKKPKVILTTTLIDADSKSNLRYSIEAVSFSRDGFMIKVNTWGDTKIFQLGGSWIAYTEKQ